MGETLSQNSGADFHAPTTQYPSSLNFSEHYDQKLIDLSLQAQKEIYVNATKEQNKMICQTQLAEKKIWLQEIKAEHQRVNYHSIVLDPNGNAIEVYSDSCLKSFEHFICNASNFTLTRLIHFTETSEQIFQIDATLNSKPISIFLNCDRIGNGNYLIRKFVSAGIMFNSDSSSRQKEYAKKLICSLAQYSEQTKIIFDAPGWYLTNEHQFIFIDKEALTWEQTFRKTQ